MKTLFAGGIEFTPLETAFILGILIGSVLYAIAFLVTAIMWLVFLYKRFYRKQESSKLLSRNIISTLLLMSVIVIIAISQVVGSI